MAIIEQLRPLIGFFFFTYGNTAGYANHKSRFAQNLLEYNHPTGPIDSIMEVLYSANKGKQMDTLEKFHIYKITRENVQINDKNTSKPNAIFDMIIREEATRRLTNR